MPPLVRKSNSTGSLARGKEGKESKGGKEGSEAAPLVDLLVTGEEPGEASAFQGESTSQVKVAGLRKNR